jgi:hypothetical protein
MNRIASLASALTILAASVLANAAEAPPSVDDLINRIESRSVRANPGVGSGALAPQNLAKKRPAAPFNMTGTWFPDLSGAFGGFRFGPPYPEFVGETKADFEKGQEMVRTRTPWRDAIGQCYPAGIPMIMTRVWPILMVQLPTAVYMVSNFNNEFRQIFLDGREWTNPDTITFTFGGESHGKFEGDTLVVETRYIETWNHYIDSGIPISEEFKVVERIRLTEKGKALEIEYVMTDPNGWVGEWRTKKRWLRLDRTDIAQVDCLPDLNDNIPSTQAGRSGLTD